MNEFDHKSHVTNLTHRPGVYRMLDERGTVIYVGKAKDLKKRVASYFNKEPDSPKTRAMVRQVQGIEITVTHTDSEALLLESNLIKKHKPRYNVIFRDDKSYPYLYLSTNETFPRLSFYRGTRKKKGRYFGPYPSAKSARRTLNLSQKLFQIRQCDESFFKNRSRPCLQYQIKRCTAPCVGLIGPGQYADDIAHTVLFLEGKNEKVIEALHKPMQKAADELDYERAAQYRDQITSLRKIQERQYVTAMKGELDIVACYMQGGQACVQVFYIRGGLNLGNKVFFPRHTRHTQAEDIITAFITQYYLGNRNHRQIPREILLSHQPGEKEVLEQVLTEQAGRKTSITYRLRGDRSRWVDMARENAELALKQKLSANANYLERLESLREFLGTDDSIERIECFDVSHTQGEAAVASCVVFNTEGANKSDYRRFNIEGIQPGDDYAAMKQVIERRYTRIKKEDGKLPDLILIDGGKGQVSSSIKILQELQLQYINLIGVAKGAARKPGLETLILSDGKTEKRLPANSMVLHLVQEVRDEAHRFAITGHKQRRQRQRSQSPLERVEGVGSKRRQQLIKYFGGLQGVTRAGVEDLAKVPGINKNLAQKIYDSFHNN